MRTIKARFGLQILSVLIALLAAWYVHSESNIGVRTFTCALEFHEASPDIIVISPTSPSVQVTVRGPSFIVDKIPLSPPMLRVQLPIDQGKKYSVPIDARSIALPPHVEIVSVVPDTVPVVVDSREEKLVPVVVPQLGSLDPGLRLEQFVIIPEQIVIRGATSRLKEIYAAQTEPLDVRKLSGEGVVELLLIPPAGPAPIVELNSRKVQIKYRTAEIAQPTPLATPPASPKPSNQLKVKVNKGSQKK